jgi:multidrug efflux system outer membrane protein
MAPEYQRPALPLPEAWPAAAQPGDAAKFDPQKWWGIYKDATLDALMDEALANNADLAVATARIDEARAQARITDAGLLPSVDASYAFARTGISKSGPSFTPGLPTTVFNDNALKLGVSYELDLWGRLRSASNAARANLLATEAARQTVRNTLTAQVAQSYYALAALDGQVQVAERTVATRQDALKLDRVRAQAGVISDFELRQAESELAAVQAQLPALRAQRDSQQRALAVLLGRAPREVAAAAFALNAGDALPEAVVPAELPSQLLLRRPDLREAEQRLIAANANIGAARAAYFPSIGLTGYYGRESIELSDLFKGPSRIFQFAAAITQPIFNAGRIGAQVDAASAQQQQALAQYKLAVSNAFRDALDALSNQRAARETLEAQNARAAVLKQALDLAKLRYANGLASQLDVLDAERNLLAVELGLLDALRAARAATADLAKALGGGF